MNEDRDDLAEGIGLLRGLISPKIGGDANVLFKLDGAGTTIAMVCCILQLVAMVIAVPAVGLAFFVLLGRIDATNTRISDVKQDIATDLKPDIQSLQDGEKAVRAYINTGLLKPKTDQEAKK